MARTETTVDDYISRCAAPVQPLLKELRALIHETLPGATEGMRYGVPSFRNAQGVPGIYLYGSKSHVNFGFLNSNALVDPQGALKGSGQPSKHIKIRPAASYDKAILADFMAQCEKLTS